MKITISKDFPYQLLFFIAVVFSYVNQYTLSIAVWLVIAFLTIRRYYSKSFLLYLSFFAIIAVLGFVRSFFYDHNTYDIIRDISYFIKPVTGLLIGYHCFRNNNINFFKTIIYCAIAIAIIHLLIVTYAVLFEFVRNVHDLRHYGGYFSDFETFALIILLFHKKFKLNISSKIRYLFIAILTISLIAYFARTNMIQFAIIVAGLLGLYQFSKQKLIISVVFIILGFITYNQIVALNPARKSTGIEAFLYKIKNGPREIYDPYVVNDNSSRFHDNFRSYETKVTIQQVLSRDDAGLYLGNGLGATVNYGSNIWTNDGTKVRHAPILHNGYITIFLKTGLVGISIYLISVFYLSFYGRKLQNDELDNIKLLINSTGIFLFISTLVFLGYYLKLDNKSLFVGGLLSYYELKKVKFSSNL